MVQGPWKIVAICISALIGQCHSFAPYPPLQLGSRTPSLVGTDGYTASSSSLTARRRNRPSSDDDDATARGNRGSGEIPQLPAIGASSFHSRSSVTSSSSTTFDATNNNSNTAFVGSNFQLQYTCKVCETRNCHIVSRIGRYTVCLFLNAFFSTRKGVDLGLRLLRLEAHEILCHFMYALPPKNSLNGSETHANLYQHKYVNI
jgi:hypothetical protein